MVGRLTPWSCGAIISFAGLKIGKILAASIAIRLFFLETGYGLSWPSSV